MTIQTRQDSLIGRPRKEEKSLYLIHPKSYPRPCFINDYIFNLWEIVNNKTIAELYEELSNKYKDISKEKIKKDLIKGLLYLYNLEMIDLSGQDLEVIRSMNANKTSIVNEGDFREVYDYMIHVQDANGLAYDFKLDRKLNCNQVKDTYNITYMRTQQIHLQEIYIKIISNSGMLTGIAGICVLGNVRTCYLTLLVIDSNKYLQKAINEIRNLIFSKNFKTIKVKSKNEKIIQSLLENKFSIEAILFDEDDVEEKKYIIRSLNNDYHSKEH